MQGSEKDQQNQQFPHGATEIKQTFKLSKNKHSIFFD